MEIKGIHIDLKAQMMRFDFLLRTVEELAEMGFNTLLLEYQDKFPYRGQYACLAAPDALTEAQIHQLKTLCQQLNMEIIPMVQCLGHMYWVTRFPPFASLGEHYREKGRGSHSLCPSREDSFRLFRSLAEQVFDLHRESKYFHIGGDEVKFSPNCPLCASQNHGALLGAYYKNILSFVEGNGFIPVMWGDMVVKYEAVAKYLPPKTLVMDWQYHKGLTASGKQRFYGEAEAFTPTDDTAFANTRHLTDLGFDVLTAPALRSMGDSCFLPSAIHLDNCVQAFYTANATGAKGILVTSWSVRRSPWPLTRPVLWVLSRLFQDTDTTLDTALADYALHAFGKPDPELGKLPFLLALAIQNAKNTGDFVSSGQDFMDPETGMFLSDSMEKRLQGMDIRNNETVRLAYSRLHHTALAIKRQLPAADTEDARWLLWAVDYTLFLSGYVAQLCLRYDDRNWLLGQLAAFDAFRSHIAILSEYYTDFSMPSEYQSRIEIHKEYIRSLLAKNS